MNKRLLLIWLSLVFFEIVLISWLGYRLYKTKTEMMPKRLHVLPINREYLEFPRDTTLQFYSEPKANVQKVEDLSLIGYHKTITHTFNADGLHERFDYSLEKGKDVFRIVSLGDSFTEGAFVETKDTYTELLEDMLNTTLVCSTIARFEVINLGVEGYDMQYTLERLKRKGLKYAPDMIILWTHENDYIETNEGLGELIIRFDPATQAAELVEYYRKNGDFYPELAVLVAQYYKEHKREELLEKGIGYLKELVDLVNNRPVIIFTLKRMPQDLKSMIENTLTANAYFYPEIPDSYGAFVDQHPSNEGHQQFAKFLFNKLINTSLSKCEKK